MPRIDPHQLLNCLQVLLSPRGGINSKNEVQRLANLMTKFSKKLVSKCIYLLILKNTERPLLGAFMGEGGWNLLHLWLQDAHINTNWALVSEILVLLLVTPVDVERLKLNNLPKLVKNLTKRDDLPEVQQLAGTLVDEWLAMVKGVTKSSDPPPTKLSSEMMLNVEDGTIPPIDTSLRLKFVRDGRQLISRVVSVNGPIDNIKEEVKAEGLQDIDEHVKDETGVSSVIKEEEETTVAASAVNETSDMKSKCVPTKSSSSSAKTSGRDKDRTSDRDRDKRRNSRSRDRSDRSKDRHKSNGAASTKQKSANSSHKSSSRSREDQAERDKITLAKIQPASLQKSGRIPKKTDDASEKRKSSFSVVVRKSSEEKPKTVKVYNSKMRSTGLLEEAKPAPPRSASKKSVTPPVIAPSSLKRTSSPPREAIPPPEKKSRLIDSVVGGVKLIAAKPKPAVLQESDIFMDALAASASAKKEPKKRKRRLSATKDCGSPPTSPKQPGSPSLLKNITPANFYQDTLVTNEAEEQKRKTNDDGETETLEKVEDAQQRTDTNGLKGVLSYGKRKGPKRSIRWRPDDELVEVQYFELDETERVNVMKPFMDMQRMEMSSERETLRANKLPNGDAMDAQIAWRELIELELPIAPAEFGCKSLERSIQLARQKQVLQAIYFNRVPESPAEPEQEVHASVDPIVIPLDDPDHPDADVPAQPWPEPKSSPPEVNNAQTMFNNVPPVFLKPAGSAFPPPNLSNFANNFIQPNVLTRPPNMPPGDWNMMPNGLVPQPPHMMPPHMMAQGPPMFDNFGGPTGGMLEEGGFGPAFDGSNGMQPMPFPPGFNMRGRGGFRRGGGPPGMGPGPNNGPWMRMTNPNQCGWNNPRPRGFCHGFKKNGFCRNRDNCPYIH